MNFTVYCDICKLLRGGSSKIDHTKCGEILRAQRIEKRPLKVSRAYLNERKLTAFLKVVADE